jgi:hypothetical protein
VLIYRRCRLRAAVALRAVEIEGCDATLTQGAIECGAAILSFGGVISHTYMVVHLSSGPWGNRCATLEQESYHWRSAETDSRLLNRYSSERYHLEVNPLILSSSATIAT